MSWPGWYDADPFVVHLHLAGTAEVLLHGERLARFSLIPVNHETEAGPEQLLVLPRNRRPPAHSPWSWVNGRGQGQIVFSGEKIIACRLVSKLPDDPSQDRTAAGGQMRHPQAGFWLALSAAMHARCTLRILQALTGYSYPTVYDWARRESAAGRLRIDRDGKVQILTPEAGAIASWWQLVRRWWPELRNSTWPKRHGPVSVHWARAPDRLPVRLVGEAITGRQADGDLLWATGVDHLTAQGRLIQPYDSDVWATASTWGRLEAKLKMLEPPRNQERWSGTRFTVFADDHPLVRLLWYAAGSRHPAGESVSVDWSAGLRQTDMISALPLLDASLSPDARVREVGLAALNTMDGVAT